LVDYSNGIIIIIIIIIIIAMKHVRTTSVPVDIPTEHLRQTASSVTASRNSFSLCAPAIQARATAGLLTRP
jgi:hypothetical protein